MSVTVGVGTDRAERAAKLLVHDGAGLSCMAPEPYAARFKGKVKGTNKGTKG